MCGCVSILRSSKNKYDSGSGDCSTYTQPFITMIIQLSIISSTVRCIILVGLLRQQWKTQSINKRLNSTKKQKWATTTTNTNNHNNNIAEQVQQIIIIVWSVVGDDTVNVVACAVAVNAAATAVAVVFIFVSCFSTCCLYALLTFNDDFDLRHLHRYSQSNAYTFIQISLLACSIHSMTMIFFFFVRVCVYVFWSTNIFIFIISFHLYVQIRQICTICAQLKGELASTLLVCMQIHWSLNDVGLRRRKSKTYATAAAKGKKEKQKNKNKKQ